MLPLLFLPVVCASFAKLSLDSVFHQNTGLYNKNLQFLKVNHSAEYNIKLGFTELDVDVQSVPDPSDPQTVLQFAWMSQLAYETPQDGDWTRLGDSWNKSSEFGWEQDGIRGYVFTDATNSILVISIKGTSASLFGIGGGPSSARDKYNDDIMFSCCCAKVDVTWRPVCDCCTASKVCDNSCLKIHSSFADSYFNLAQTITTAVKSTYPRASIFLTGHSLGGAVASLVGISNKLPALTFEAPGELMYAQRIGLVPQFLNLFEKEKFLKSLFVYHYGNTGDPVYLGSCNGPSSSCYITGYAMESKCHTGKVCPYSKSDKQLSEKVDIRNHRLTWFISEYLSVMDHVPECFPEVACQDCSEWEFS